MNPTQEWEQLLSHASSLDPLEQDHGLLFESPLFPLPLSQEPVTDWLTWPMDLMVLTV